MPIAIERLTRRDALQRSLAAGAAVAALATVDATVEALTAAGDRVTRRIYPGLAHRIDPRELHDAVDFLQKSLGAGTPEDRTTPGKR